LFAIAVDDGKRGKRSMSDWDAVRKAAEESAELRRQDERRSSEASAWEKAAEDALEQRIDQFAQGLSGNLFVSREWRRLDGHYWMLVIIGKKPMDVAGPDVVAEIRLESNTHYFLKNPPMGVSKNFFTLPALVDQLIAMAAEVVSSPSAGTLPACRGKNYVQYLERQEAALKWQSWFSNAYGVVGMLVGAATFFGSLYLIQEAFGLMGLLLGWLPALIAGVLAGLFWGPILIALLLMYVLSD